MPEASGRGWEPPHRARPLGKPAMISLSRRSQARVIIEKTINPGVLFPHRGRPQGAQCGSVPENLNSHLQQRAAGCWQMIATMGDDNLLALLIGKKVNAQHFAAGANLTLYVGRDVAGSPPLYSTERRRCRAWASSLAAWADAWAAERL